MAFFLTLWTICSWKFQSAIFPAIFHGPHPNFMTTLVTMINLNASQNTAMRSWHLVPKITFCLKNFKPFLCTLGLQFMQSVKVPGPLVDTSLQKITNVIPTGAVKQRSMELLLFFSLTWDPMVAKFSKRYFSHSFGLISTKLYDKYVIHGKIEAIIFLSICQKLKILWHFKILLTRDHMGLEISKRCSSQSFETVEHWLPWWNTWWNFWQQAKF